MKNSNSSANKTTVPKLALNNHPTIHETIMNEKQLQLEVEKFRGAEKGLLELRKLSETTSAWRAQQESTVDLADKTGLLEIGRLQVLTGLFPARIKARETELAAAEPVLLRAAHEFVQQDLAPRARKLLASTRERARAALQPHISRKAELDAAVERADEVILARDSFDFTISVDMAPADGAMPYALRLLELSKRVDALAAKLG